MATETPSAPCSGSRSGECLTPTVSLLDWWLVKAQSDSGEKRLGVGGIAYSEDGAAQCFLSAPIVKRCHAVLIETVDGFEVLLEGILNRSAMLENGFNSMVCDNFETGFPDNWEDFASQSPGEKSDSRPNDVNLPKETPMNLNDEGSSVQIASETTNKRSDDGYNWRKYGQKSVKGNKFIRSYYRCAYPRCQAKKQVEGLHDGSETGICYLEVHQHSDSQEGSANDVDSDKDDSSDSEGRKRESTADEVLLNDEPLNQSRHIVQTVSEVDLVHDGYRWRKYGQKMVRGSPYPRSYYRCSNAGCPAKKLVERASEDRKVVITTYEGEHSHNPVVRRIPV